MTWSLFFALVIELGQRRCEQIDDKIACLEFHRPRIARHVDDDNSHLRRRAPAC